MIVDETQALARGRCRLSRNWSARCTLASWWARFISGSRWILYTRTIM